MIPRIHSATLRERLGHVALVVSCGDLPASYLEFIADALNRPVYYVLGNHAEELTRRCSGNRSCQTERRSRSQREGHSGSGDGTDSRRDSRAVRAIARTNRHNISDWEIGLMAAKMAPRLHLNRLRQGRALDLLVSHAPPRDVNDRPDPAHRGFEPLRGFLEKWRPAYHIHGHVHLYDRSQSFQQRFADTDVINVFPYRVLELEPGHASSREAAAASP